MRRYELRRSTGWPERRGEAQSSDTAISTDRPATATMRTRRGEQPGGEVSNLEPNAEEGNTHVPRGQNLDTEMATMARVSQSLQLRPGTRTKAPFGHCVLT